jgi:hypothetical protein
MPESFVTALKAVADKPLALLGYALLLGAWAYVAVARHRLNRVAAALSTLPAKHRADVLKQEYGVQPTTGLTAEEWLRAQRQRLVFIAVLAFIIAVMLLGGITITEAYRARTEAQSIRLRAGVRPVDWQMRLAVDDVQFYSTTGNLLGVLECGRDTSAPAIPADSLIVVKLKVYLVIDNVYSKFRELIYPIGLSTTWDHQIHELYDGRDVDQVRQRTSVFQRRFDQSIQIRTPHERGRYFVVLMSGAALSSRQLFTFRADEIETADSAWAPPIDLLRHGSCGTHWSHTFVRNDGVIENASFPFASIPIEVK